MPNGPMPGDAVILTGEVSLCLKGDFGIINGVVGEARDEYEVTFRPYCGRAFRGSDYAWSKGPEYVTVSGGPAETGTYYMSLAPHR